MTHLSPYWPSQIYQQANYDLKHIWSIVKRHGKYYSTGMRLRKDLLGTLKSLAKSAADQVESDMSNHRLPTVEEHLLSGLKREEEEIDVLVRLHEAMTYGEGEVIAQDTDEGRVVYLMTILWEGYIPGVPRRESEVPDVSCGLRGLLQDISASRLKVSKEIIEDIKYLIELNMFMRKTS